MTAMCPCGDVATCISPYAHCTCKHYGSEPDGSPVETDSAGCPVHGTIPAIADMGTDDEPF